MAKNAVEAYGRDIACVHDADALFSDTVGLGVVRQDAIHRILTDDVLGPGGDGWGYDSRKILGEKREKVQAFRPILEEVLTRDERVLRANVTLTLTGETSLEIAVTCETDLGPFSFVVAITQVSNSAFEVQVR
jgi:hypothetical protein